MQLCLHNVCTHFNHNNILLSRISGQSFIFWWKNLFFWRKIHSIRFEIVHILSRCILRRVHEKNLLSCYFYPGTTLNTEVIPIFILLVIFYCYSNYFQILYAQSFLKIWQNRAKYFSSILHIHPYAKSGTCQSHLSNIGSCEKTEASYSCTVSAVP